MRGMKNTSFDFSQSREAWEHAVFREASHFVVLTHAGRDGGFRPKWQRQEFQRSQLEQAIEAANAPTASGRGRLLYAITREGRQIILSKADHPKWLAADRTLAADQGNFVR
jgi:hypothetical protein